jgi:hypothetical protein
LTYKTISNSLCPFTTLPPSWRLLTTLEFFPLREILAISQFLPPHCWMLDFGWPFTWVENITIRVYSKKIITSNHFYLFILNFLICNQSSWHKTLTCLFQKIGDMMFVLNIMIMIYECNYIKFYRYFVRKLCIS